jgi:Recombinase
MARRRLRRKRPKARRRVDPVSALFEGLEESRPVEPANVPETAPTPAVQVADAVVRLVYTRTQAAAALGVSPATFARRVMPLIEMVEMPWGTQLVPVDELERLVSDSRRPARGRTRAKPVGHRRTLPDNVVRRIAAEHEAGRSLGEIARGLNADRVPRAHGGTRWWPSTVRAVLNRVGDAWRSPPGLKPNRD